MLKLPPVEVQQQHKLPTPSPPPRPTSIVTATEFASESMLDSLEIVARPPTVTVRFMATLKCPAWTRELCGVRSKAFVSLTVRLIVAARRLQQRLAPLPLMAARIRQQVRNLKSIAIKSVTGLRMG